MDFYGFTMIFVDLHGFIEQTWCFAGHFIGRPRFTGFVSTWQGNPRAGKSMVEDQTDSNRTELKASFGH